MKKKRYIGPIIRLIILISLETWFIYMLMDNYVCVNSIAFQTLTEEYDMTSVMDNFFRMNKVLSFGIVGAIVMIICELILITQRVYENNSSQKVKKLNDKPPKKKQMFS